MVVASYIIKATVLILRYNLEIRRALGPILVLVIIIISMSFYIHNPLLPM